MGGPLPAVGQTRSAKVVPFPRARNRSFVAKHARNVARMAAAAGERYLAQQLQVQRETMLRRGIDPALVETEIQALEAAIRAGLWRLVLTPDGAA